MIGKTMSLSVALLSALLATAAAVPAPRFSFLHLFGSNKEANKTNKQTVSISIALLSALLAKAAAIPAGRFFLSFCWGQINNLITKTKK